VAWSMIDELTESLHQLNGSINTLYTVGLTTRDPAVAAQITASLRALRPARDVIRERLNLYLKHKAREEHMRRQMSLLVAMIGLLVMLVLVSGVSVAQDFTPTAEPMPASEAMQPDAGGWLAADNPRSWFSEFDSSDLLNFAAFAALIVIVFRIEKMIPAQTMEAIIDKFKREYERPIKNIIPGEFDDALIDGVADLIYKRVMKRLEEDKPLTARREPHSGLMPAQEV
jgi:hypothetical protein